ncbi:hypothetical protein F4777DRAFT_559257 [Nemania sp. FL0916]|nr:hypothetical protein F4777DRAFT_559257 [Nemania sp. FL0916]
MEPTLQVVLSRPITETLNTQWIIYVNKMRSVLLNEVCSTIVSSGYMRPPRIEVVATVLPLKDTTELDAMLASKSASSSPIPSDSPPQASKALPQAPQQAPPLASQSDSCSEFDLGCKSGSDDESDLDGESGSDSSDGESGLDGESGSDDESGSASESDLLAPHAKTSPGSIDDLTPTNIRKAWAWGTLCQTYPQARQILEPAKQEVSFEPFVSMPARRSLASNSRGNRKLHYRRKTNIKAALMQIAGLDNSTSACVQCRKGGGLWTGYVIAPPKHAGALRGSCANCYVTGIGSKCSLQTSHNPPPVPPSQKAPTTDPSSESVSIMFMVETQCKERCITDNGSCLRVEVDSTQVYVPLDKILGVLPAELDRSLRTKLVAIALAEPQA